MAETIVNLVLGKLADAVVQEALFLYGVHDKVEQVRRELTWIQSFLKDADTKRHKDERIKKWVNEVQQVGYLIEDVLDKFLAEVGGSRPEGLRNILKRIGKMTMKPIAKQKLGNEIDKIQQRICEISENKKKYGIEVLEETSSRDSVEKSMRPFVNPDIDEIEVVGFEADNKTIVNQLIDTNITRRSVISIVGAGGSGKTTLAKMVYKSAEVKRHFGSSCMWLTISNDYKLIDILMKMLEEIIGKLNAETQNKREEYFITELNKFIREKKYLIVLDDVWSSIVWTQLKVALPNADNGSRVLITTRFIKVAEEIDRISKPHVIRPLNEVESEQLLLKKIFPNQFANECPNNLLPLVTQFTNRCRGWPLPLVVLGGILSRTNPDYITWDEVMQNMDWQTDDSSFMGVISTSYEDLPAALKPCFKYFGVFPEDYQIKAKTLFHLWIAEGFIRQDGTKSLEDIAESYLEELVQRCLVQVSMRSCICKIRCCHIHDLLRDLAIQKAKEDNFLTVDSKNDTKMNCSTCAPRVALHVYGNEMNKHAFTNLRSLINFEDVSNLKKFGTLRVLHISTATQNPHYRLLPPRKGGLYKSNYLEGLNKLTALKYFGFEDNYSSYCQFSTGWFSKRSPLIYMKNLQTVRVPVCTTCGELPPSFWSNEHLRHIILSSCRWCQADTDGPPSAANVESLLTLKGVRARQDWVGRLPNFPYIRKLGLEVPEDVALEPLINLLSKLNHLGALYLSMRGDKNKPRIFPCYISAFKNYKRLYSIKLKRGRWPRKEVGDSIMFPTHLVKLTLQFFSFEDDPMLQLEKLPNLKVLKLYHVFIKATGEKKMISSKGGFGCLQRLIFYVDDLEEWKIEEGAIPMLNQLKLECPNMQIFPELQYLANLQEFILLGSTNVCSMLHKQDQWKIKHIPSVIFKNSSYS